MYKLKQTATLLILFLFGCSTSETEDIKHNGLDSEHTIKEEEIHTFNLEQEETSKPIDEPILEAQEVIQGNEDVITMVKFHTPKQGPLEEKQELPSYIPEKYKDTKQVALKEVNLREGPHTRYSAITTLSKNTKLSIFEKATVDETVWYHITVEGSKEKTGWISAKTLEEIPEQGEQKLFAQQEAKEDKIESAPPETPTFQAVEYHEDLEITANVGNVRKGPGLTYSVITGLKNYTKVVAFEKAVVDKMTWYHASYHNDKKGWVASSIVDKYNPDRKVVLIEAPHIKQLPELPRGCEVTSLAMLLGHAGVSVDKMTLAKEIKRDQTPYEIKDGKIYFGNPYTGFVGDMYSFETPGLGVYHGPIAELGEKYLPGRIVNLTGQGIDAIYKQLDQGKPVWVISTSTFAYLPDSYWETWHTPTGELRITYKEHSVLVTGYDDKYIYFNDPLASKNRKVKLSNFIAGWGQFGNQAISYN